jgi:hypothetical protein
MAHTEGTAEPFDPRAWLIEHLREDDASREFVRQHFSADVEAAADFIAGKRIPGDVAARRYVHLRARDLDKEREALIADAERASAAARQIQADAASGDPERLDRAAHYLPRFEVFASKVNDRLTTHRAATDAFKLEVVEIVDYLRTRDRQRPVRRRRPRAALGGIRRRPGSARRPRERSARRARGTRAGPDDDSGPAPHQGRRRPANRRWPR